MAVVFVVAMFMTIMDSTVVNVAVPTLARDFDARTSVEWVVTGYLLSLAIWIPTSGWIGDRFGTKRVFLAALVIFVMASLLCGAATSLGQLTAFRVVQGIGGGLMMPVGTALLFRAFPPERRARASQVLIVPTVVAPAAGPVVGGLLVDQLSWRWVFAVNVPIGVAAIVFGAVFLVEHREEEAGSFDSAGFVLSGVSLGAVLYAISQGAVAGWTSPPVLLAALAGVVGSVLLVRVELALRAPMLDLRLLGDRLFRTSNLVCLFSYSSFLGLLFVMSLYLQRSRGASALETGLTTFPEALGVLAASQVVSRVYMTVGPRRLMTGGLLALAALAVAMAVLVDDVGLWGIRALMFGMGCAMGCVFMPQQAATFATISARDTGRASAIYSMQRQIGAALGVAILATVLARSGSDATPASYRVVFVTAALLALVGAAVARTIHDQDAAGTMRPKPPATPPHG